MVSNQQSKPPISPDTVSFAQQGPSLPRRSLESPQTFSGRWGGGGTVGGNGSCLSGLPCQLYNFPSPLPPWQLWRVAGVQEAGSCRAGSVHKWFPEALC